jgi:ankyrin repeat protein
MASNATRKRKHSDSIATSSPRSRAFEDAARDVGGIGHGVVGRDIQGGQNFVRPIVQDHAKAHYGNVYNFTNSTIETTPEERKFQAFMNALRFPRMDFRQAAIDPAHAETCQWIFEQERFSRWRDPAFRNSNHGLLWIKGKPGSGKSTLMKCILERLEHEAECAVVAFFFNARGGGLEHSLEGCYRSLLHQLLDQAPRLRTYLRITSIPTDGQHWELAAIRNYLREAVLHLRHESLVLMVDALDECDLQEIRDMVYFLDSLATSTALQGISFNICLASRHYPNVSIRLCEKLIVENEDSHTRDIYKYVRANLHTEPETQRYLLVQHMMHKSEGVFLWVVLVTRRLNERFDSGANLAELLLDIEALPDQLDTLIQGIISFGASDACFLPMMLWTLVVSTKMTSDEFCFAIKFCAGRFTSPRWDQYTLSADDPAAAKRFVLQSSKGLVELIGHDLNLSSCSTQFVHESVRQHILRGGLAGLRPTLSCNVEAVSHAIMASWLQDYVRNGSWDDVEPLSDLWDDSLAQAFPLLNYVSCSTFAHMESAHARGALEIGDLRRFPLKHWIGFRKVTWPDRLIEPTASFIHLCIEELEDVCHPGIPKDLLRMHPRHCKVTADPISGTSSLDEESSTMLFGVSFNDFCGGRYGTPLVAAAFLGHTTIAECLLGYGADVNVCSDSGISSLVRTNQTGQYVIHLHIDRLEGALRTEYGSPLAAAAAGRFDWYDEQLRLPLVQSLLDHGAEIDARTGIAGTALGSAIWHGHEEITRMLLDHGADINLEDSEGLNIALYNTIVAPDRFLTSHYRQRMFELLFGRGVRAKPAAFNIFLHIAAQCLQVSTIEMLVHAGADPHYRDHHSRNAMHVLAEKCAWTTFDDTADLLLDLGVDINAVGGEYDTALIAASSRGHEQLVKYLLNHGADVGYKSDKHGTAIDVARAADDTWLEQNYEEIIQMLMEAGLK